MAEPEGERSFLVNATCSLCQGPIVKAESKELIRIRSFKLYLDIHKEMGNPATRTKQVWCTDCTLWFLEQVGERRAARMAERERAGQAGVLDSHAADGSDVGRGDECAPLPEDLASDDAGGGVQVPVVGDGPPVE